jgi:hypothetical protein
MTTEQIQVVIGEVGGPTEMRDVAYYKDSPGGVGAAVPVTVPGEAIVWHIADGTPVIIQVDIQNDSV